METLTNRRCSAKLYSEHLDCSNHLAEAILKIIVVILAAHTLRRLDSGKRFVFSKAIRL